MEKFRKIVNYLSAYWAIILYGSVLLSFIKKGVLPEYSRPDPKTVISGHDFFYFVFVNVLLLIIVAFVLNVIYVIRRLKEKNSFIEPSLIFFISNVFFLIIVKFYDPWGFLEWFID